MISTKNRFKGHKSLNYVYRNGKTVRTGLYGIKYVANTKRTDWRLAVVVSKKIDPLAVGRNRIRRRMYELFRKNIPSTFGGIDMVVTVYDKRLAQEDDSKLQAQLLEMFDKISLS